MKSPVMVTHSLLRPWGGGDLREGVSLQDILGEAAKLPSQWLAASLRIPKDATHGLLPVAFHANCGFPHSAIWSSQTLSPRRRAEGVSSNKTNGNFLFESDTRAPRKNMCGAILSFTDHNMEESMCDVCHWWQWDLYKRIKGVGGYLFFSPLQGEKLKGRALVSTGGSLHLLC